MIFLRKSEMSYMDSTLNTLKNKWPALTGQDRFGMRPYKSGYQLAII